MVEGVDPDGINDTLEFLRKMLKEIERLAVTDFELVDKSTSVKGISVVKIDENGRFSA